MKSSQVTITLGMEAEFELMNKYGRRCSREGLVMRAVQDAIKNGAQAETPKGRKPRKKKEPPIAEGPELPLAGERQDA